jgi:CRP/FNR family transcriptional regulator/CRP/FNR family cyclic AMP-dependent transcriptional regulator
MSIGEQMLQRLDSARLRTCLAASVHFRELPADDLDCIAGLGRISALKDGQLLYRAGSKLHSLWIVLGGSLRISSTGDGEEFVYAVLGPGSFFGLGYVLSSKLLAVSAGAYGATEVAAIDGERFLALLDKSPRLWRHVGGLLANRLSLAMLAVRDISSAPLDKRIVRRLLGQASGGRDLYPGGRVELRLTQSDLAAMLGASRSKVNAELKRLESRRMIEVGYRTIALVSLPKLHELAGQDVFAF